MSCNLQLPHTAPGLAAGGVLLLRQLRLAAVYAAGEHFDAPLTGFSKGGLLAASRRPFSAGNAGDPRRRHVVLEAVGSAMPRRPP